MTAKNPTWIDGIAVSGQELRLAQGMSMAPAGALLARSGVRMGATDLAVTANGTPNMSVNVAAGQAFVAGTESATQGGSVVTNDATVNLAIAAADATNPRIDIVVARWYSETVAVGSRKFALEVVTGTPAASPAVPSTPANSLVLAQIAVAAAAASITNANITDKRAFTAALGGLVVCTSTTRPSVPYDGMPVYETDTDRVAVYNGVIWTYADIIPMPRRTMAKLRQTAAQSLANNTLVAINFDAEDLDTDNAHSTVSNTSRFTAPYAGWYRAGGVVWFAGNATGLRYARWLVNGAEVNGSLTGYNTVPNASSIGITLPSTLIFLNAGDYLEMGASQTSGGALNTLVSGVLQPSMSVEFVGS